MKCFNLLTDELFIEVTKHDNYTLNIYHRHDNDLMIESHLSNREMKALINTLNKVSKK